MKLEQAARQIIVDWDSGIHLYEAITALREALAASEWEEDNGMSIAEIFAKQEALAERKVLTMTQEEMVDAIRSAKIEQAEQEPVAWMEDSIEFYASDNPSSTFTIPLYAAPVRTKALTDDEIRFWIGRFPFLLNEKSEKWVIGLARAVIAADREKNK